MLHKVLNSYLFLGFLRMSRFALLTGLQDAEFFQKHKLYLGNPKYPPGGKFSHPFHFHLFLSLFLCCPSLFFPRTSFSLPGFSMALGSVYHDLARLKRLGEIPFSFSPFLSFSFEIKKRRLLENNGFCL